MSTSLVVSKDEALICVPADVLDRLDIRSRTILCCCIRWYFQDEDRCNCLLTILQRKAGYSLRIIDWMVTNYCKRNPLTILYNGNPISVHSDYERHLSVYNKRYYDPFARREKIQLNILGCNVITTVGQLNFFKWFIERKLDSLVKDHQAAIEQDMKQGPKAVSSVKTMITMHHGEFSVGFV